MTESAVNIIRKNLDNLGLDLAPHKTEIIHFNNYGYKPGDIEIRLDDHNKIKTTHSARYLGIIFDYQLSFTQQVDHVINRSNAALNCLKYVRGVWWGADPSTMLILYKALVRSIIDYASFIYYPNATIAQKLERLQYSAIRISLGYRTSTPTNILIAESKLDTIRERSAYLCKNYISKVLSNTGLPVNKAIKRLYSSRAGNRTKKTLFFNCLGEVFPLMSIVDTRPHFSYYNYEFDTAITAIPFDSHLGRSLQAASNPMDVFNEFSARNQALQIFTDGSKIQHGASVGAAFYSDKGSATQSINVAASIFTTETIALNMAIDFAASNPNEKVHIFCDSLSVLQKLNSANLDIKTNPLIFQIKKKIIDFNTSNNTEKQIKLFWIPAHLGITGNENADSLAKEATDNAANPIISLPFSDLRENFKLTAKESTRSLMRQQGLEKGVVYFETFYTESPKPWFHHFRLRRKEIVTMNRCRANHYGLAHSLARLGIVADAGCDCGWERQDLDHILWQCPEYDDQRSHLLKSLPKLNFQLPMTSTILLHQPNTRICKTLVKFLDECNLQI